MSKIHTFQLTEWFKIWRLHALKVGHKKVVRCHKLKNIRNKSPYIAIEYACAMALKTNIANKTNATTKQTIAHSEGERILLSLIPNLNRIIIVRHDLIKY